VQVRVRRHGGRPPLLRHPPRRVRRRRDQQRVLPLLRTSTFLCFHHLFLSYLLNAYASSSFHHSPLTIDDTDPSTPSWPWRCCCSRLPWPAISSSTSTGCRWAEQQNLDWVLLIG
jgi:hypothetical protein